MLNVRGLKSMKFGVFFVDLGMCVLAARSLTVLLSSKSGFVAIIPLSCVRSMVTFIYSLKTYSYGIEI